jgi:hypothetical protein
MALQEALPDATSNCVAVVHTPPPPPPPEVQPAPIASAVSGPPVPAEARPTGPDSTVDDDLATPVTVPAIPAAPADVGDVNVVADSAAEPVIVKEVSALSALAAPQPPAGAEAVSGGTSNGAAGVTRVSDVRDTPLSHSKC